MDNELYHYGVKGMRWGVTRARQKTGSSGNLTKSQMKREFKDDKKKAFENGREGTALGRAMVYGSKKLIKLEKKIDKAYEKDPNGAKKSTQKKVHEWEKNAKTLMQIGEQYNKVHENSKKHVNELISKYGKDIVNPIKYKKFKNDRVGEYELMNERVASGKEWIKSIVVTLSPLPIVMRPASANSRGKSLYTIAKMLNDRRDKNAMQRKRK